MPPPPSHEARRDRTGSNSNVHLGGSRFYAQSEYQLACFGNCPQYKRKDITLKQATTSTFNALSSSLLSIHSTILRHTIRAADSVVKQ